MKRLTLDRPTELTIELSTRAWCSQAKRFYALVELSSEDRKRKEFGLVVHSSHKSKLK